MAGLREEEEKGIRGWNKLPSIEQALEWEQVPCPCHGPLCRVNAPFWMFDKPVAASGLIPVASKLLSISIQNGSQGGVFERRVFRGLPSDY